MINRNDFWSDYQLIDSGYGEKLERFGTYVTARPEPLAMWNKSMEEEQWNERADAHFDTFGMREDWRTKPEMPRQWFIDYRYKEMALKLRLGLTPFKHVGIFPEQAENWNYIYDTISQLRETVEQPRVLNLFAYTGGATLAARSAGAEVTHVDALKQAIAWGRENMEASGLSDVRWIVDDAIKFAAREIKRGRKYNGIILDPPAFGRGTGGERWILAENLGEMLDLCAELLEDKDAFIVLNLYSHGLSPEFARDVVIDSFGRFDQQEWDELGYIDSFDRPLSMGVYYRGRR